MKRETCPHCGAPLASFEGETFCPDCTAWTIEQAALEALDEALACRAAEAAALALPEADAGDELPF